MTGDERPQRTQGESRDTKRRSRPLIVTGIVLLGVAALVLLTGLLVIEAGRNDALGVSFLTATGIGVVCIVLGCIPLDCRLMVLGILLLGVGAACAAFLADERYVRAQETAVYAFVIAVSGVSGLVCVALDFVRMLSSRKGT